MATSPIDWTQFILDDEDTKSKSDDGLSWGQFVLDDDYDGPSMSAAPNASRGLKDFLSDQRHALGAGVSSSLAGTLRTPVELANAAVKYSPLRMGLEAVNPKAGIAVQNALHMEQPDFIEKPAAYFDEIAEQQRERYSLAHKDQAHELDQDVHGFMGTLGWLAKNPAYSTTQMTEVLAQMLPGTGLAKGVGTGAKLLEKAGKSVGSDSKLLSRGADLLNTNKGQAALNVGAQAGMAGSLNQKEVMDTLEAMSIADLKKVEDFGRLKYILETDSDQDVKDWIIKNAGTNSFAQSFAINAVTPYLIPGGTTVERALLGQKMPGTSRATNALLGGASEFTEEMLAEMGEQTSENILTYQPWNKDLGKSGAIGSVMGFGSGSTLGGLATPASKPPIKDGEDLLNGGGGPGAQPGQADQTVMDAAQGEAAKERTATAEEVTAAARNRLKELNSKADGTPDQTVIGPDGKRVTIRGRWAEILNDDETAERKWLSENIDNVEALANAYGVTIQERHDAAQGGAPIQPQPIQMTAEQAMEQAGMILDELSALPPSHLSDIDNDRLQALFENRNNPEEIAKILGIELIDDAAQGEAANPLTNSDVDPFDPDGTAGLKLDESQADDVQVDTKADTPDYSERLLELRRKGKDRSPEESSEYIALMEEDRTTTKVGGRPLVGVRNFTQYEDDRADGVLPKYTIISDADNFKALNDEHGHEFGDEVIRVIGSTLRDVFSEIGARAYHRSGDEFLGAHDDPAVLEAAAKEANRRLKSATFEVTAPNGRVISRTGVQFSYGIGLTAQEAEAGLQEQKDEKLKTGERRRRHDDRGTPGRDADRVGSEGDQALDAEGKEAGEDSGRDARGPQEVTIPDSAPTRDRDDEPPESAPPKEAGKPGMLLPVKFIETLAEYGFSVVDRALVTPSGKKTSSVISVKGGQVTISGKDGHKAWSGSPENVGLFLERFWGAKKRNEQGEGSSQPEPQDEVNSQSEDALTPEEQQSLPSYLANMGEGRRERAGLYEAAKARRTADGAPIVNPSEADAWSASPESAMAQVLSLEDAIKSLNARLSRNVGNITHTDLIDAWKRHGQLLNAISNSRQENPELWREYDERQAALSELGVGDAVILPFPYDSENGPHVGTIVSKHKKNWKVRHDTGHEVLYRPESLSPYDDAASAPRAPRAPKAPVAPPQGAGINTPEQHVAGQVPVTMQNRDRSRVASVGQMQSIRNSPDPERLGFSRDPNTGAPMVGEGRAIPDADKGASDVVIGSDGRRVPVRYAVVEAGDLSASHDVYGRVNPDYASAPLKALNNGRVAGIQAAWRHGNGDAYKAGLIADAHMHGVSPGAIQGKQNPVLVRLYDPAENRNDMGAWSNTGAQLEMSPVERAQTDARALPPLEAIEWAEDGSLPPAANAKFFRAWFKNLGAAQAAGLQDAQGRPNAAALQRVRAALVYRAYGDERLLTALVEEVNPDHRNVMHALVRAAPAFAALDQNDPLAQDIRARITEALEILRQAVQRGVPLEAALAQTDMLGRAPEAEVIAAFLGQNARSVRRMADAIRAMAVYVSDAQSQAATIDIFGNAAVPNVRGAIEASNHALREEYGEQYRIELPAEHDTGTAEPRDRSGEHSAGGRSAVEEAERSGEVREGEGSVRQGQPGSLTLSAPSSAPAASTTPAPAQSGLFAPPTRREMVDAEIARRDAERNGQTATGRTDMMAGDGELFAGPRPEQVDIEDQDGRAGGSAETGLQRLEAMARRLAEKGKAGERQFTDDDGTQYIVQSHSFDGMLRPREYDLWREVMGNANSYTFQPSDTETLVIVKVGKTIYDGRRFKVERNVYMPKPAQAEIPAPSPQQEDTKPEKPDPESTDGTSGKVAPPVLDDFGEKLEGARKDMPPSLKEDMSDEKIASLPLSKIWPSDAHESIEDDAAAALVFAARQEIPAKPRVPSRVRTWVSKVKAYRTLVNDLGENSLERIEQLSKEKGFHSLGPFFAKVRLLSQLPREHWKRIGKVAEYPSAHRYEDGKQVAVPFSEVQIDGKSRRFPVGKIGPDEVRNVLELLSAAAPSKDGLTAKDFEIRMPRGGGSAFINRKGDPEYRPLKTFTGDDAVKQARAWLNDNVAGLESAWEAVKARDNVSKADTRRNENRERVGENRRDGKDVTEQMFTDAFGFRGVQFGNWVGQGKGAKDRQGLLNEAYDALLDLADILGIPSRAISLDGTLGLSLGARGSGRASAHFERDSLVINLTKTRGAGTLAHEWFHAIDNYFSRKRGTDATKPRDGDYITYRPETVWVKNDGHLPRAARLRTAFTSKMLRELIEANGQWDNNKTLDENADAFGWRRHPDYPQGVRPEVERAFAELVAALNASPMFNRAARLDKGAQDYWSRIIERGARSFENYVISKMAQRGWTNDFLANVRDWQGWAELGKNQERYPYLRPEEEAPIVEAFDALFNTIESRTDPETGNVALFNRRGGAAPGSRPIPRSRLDSLVEHLTRNQPDGKARVRIADRWADLPAEIRAEAERQGFDPATETIPGVAYKGNIYLVHEYITSEKLVEETLFHERVHQVLRNNTSDPDSTQLRGALQSLYNKLGAIEGLRRAAKQAGVSSRPSERQGNALRQAMLREAKQRGTPDIIAVSQANVARAVLTMEEFLADLEGGRAYESIPRALQRKFHEALGRLRQWLRDNGFTRLAKALGQDLDTANLADLRALLWGIRQQAEGTGDAAVRFIRVWHGTGTGKAGAKVIVGDLPAEPDGHTRLFHGGGDGITEVRAGHGRFGALFASSNLSSASGGAFVEQSYYADIPDEKILTDYALNYELGHEGVRRAFKRATGLSEGSEHYDLVWEAVIKDGNVFDMDESSVLEAFDIESLGEAAWEAQKLRGEVASALGYQAVEVSDEHGTSYMLLPGVKLNPIGGARYSIKPSDNFDQPADYTFRASDYRPTVVEWARETFGHRIAPNGKPVWQNFVRYFSDSKVVDANGKPLVVYHGTTAEFYIFDPEIADDTVGGWWFTDDNNYAYELSNGGWNTRGVKDPSSRVLNVYLSMENPLRYDVVAEANHLADEIGVERPADANEAQYLLAGSIGWDNVVADLVSDAKRAGHDGLIIDNFQDGRLTTSTAYIAFRPEQIKSATGNTGDFDAANPDIRFSQPYTHDLFGNELPKKRPIPKSHTRLQDTPATMGNYLVRTIVGTETSRTMGEARIQSMQQLAHATTYLYQYTEERFDAIVTDKDGKPLAVVGGFKGAIAEAPVYLSVVVGEAMRVPGAANIWFTHNHPSGLSELSRADRALFRHLTDAFQGTGIEPRAIIAIGENEYSGTDNLGNDDNSITLGTPTGDGPEIPVITRIVEKSLAQRPKINNPADALQIARSAHAAEGDMILLLDNRHGVVARIPISSVMRGPLRDTGGSAAIYRAISESNAAAAIIAHDGSLDAGPQVKGRLTISENIIGALNLVDIRVLDSINVNTGASEAAMGGNLHSKVMFSRRAAPDVHAQQVHYRSLLSSISDAVKNPGRTVTDAMRSATEQWRPAWLKAFTLDQLVDLGSTRLPQLSHYADFVQKIDTMRNVMQAEAGVFANDWLKWAKKNRAENDRLVDLMHDATLEGTDPAEPFQLIPIIHNNEKLEPTPENVDVVVAGIERQMRERPDDSKALAAELKAVKGIIARNRVRKAAHAELSARWNKLSPKAQEIYRGVRDMYADRRDARESALIKNIRDLKLSQKRTKLAIARVQAMFESQRVESPYFPLQRTGDFWIAATDTNGQQVYVMRETYKSWVAAQESMKRDGFTINATGRKGDTIKSLDGASAAFITQVIQSLQMANTPASVQDQIYQIYLQSLPDMNQRKHMIHRKKVSGYSRDAIRSFGTNMLREAHQLARMRYSNDLVEMVNVMQRHNDAKRADPDISPKEVAASDALLNELRKRHEFIMNPQASKASSVIGALGFVFYLGLTPAAALVNTTQVMQVSFPELGSHPDVGFPRAAALLSSAMADAMRTYGNIQRTLTDPDEIRAFKRFVEIGTIETTQAHNLTGLAEGESLRYNPAYARIMDAISHLFHKAEVINRQATAMAGFRAMILAGEGFDYAVKYGDSLNRGTHFNYSNANRAPWMQGNVMRVITMFKQYAQNMTFFMGRHLYKSMKGESPDVRRQSLRAFTMTMGMTGVFSGVLGLPWMLPAIFYALEAVVNAFGDDDDYFDAEAEFRNILADMFGVRIARVIAHGPMNELTGANFASRIGVEDLWIRDADRELEGRDEYFYWIEQLLGPVGGIGKNFFLGKEMIKEGKVMRGLETMAPKAVKDVMKAARYMTEGVTNSRGELVIEDLSPYQAALQAAGFSPAEVAEQYEGNRAAKNYEAAIEKRKRALMDAFALAIMTKDKEAEMQIVGKIHKFNKKHPAYSFTASGVRASLRGRARASDRTEGGIILNRRLRDESLRRSRFAREQESVEGAP